MIYQQHCTWALCGFDDISTQKKSMFALLMIYQQNLHTNIDCLLFLLVYHKTCNMALILLLIYHQKRKVSMYSFVDISTAAQHLICVFLSNTFDKSTTEQLTTLLFVIKKTGNSTSTNQCRQNICLSAIKCI